MTDGRTESRLLGKRVRLIQPKRGYRVAIDPVLLAAATPARQGERVLDVGAGVGAASLCLAARVAGVFVCGLEIQSDLVAINRMNITLNAFDDRMAVVEGNLLDAPVELAPRSFERVMTNPPYLPDDAHTPPPDPGKAIAHGEGAADLERWIAFCRRMVKPRGTLTIIHRADRLDDLLAALHGRFGGIVVYPLWPRSGEAARRVIVHARDGVKTPARLAPGLVLHGQANTYTPAAEAVLREGAAIPVDA